MLFQMRDTGRKLDHSLKSLTAFYQRPRRLSSIRFQRVRLKNPSDKQRTANTRGRDRSTAISGISDNSFEDSAGSQRDRWNIVFQRTKCLRTVHGTELEWRLCLGCVSTSNICSRQDAPAFSWDGACSTGTKKACLAWRRDARPTRWPEALSGPREMRRFENPRRRFFLYLCRSSSSCPVFSLIDVSARWNSNDKRGNFVFFYI